LYESVEASSVTIALSGGFLWSPLITVTLHITKNFRWLCFIDFVDHPQHHADPHFIGLLLLISVHVFCLNFVDICPKIKEKK